MKRTSATKLVWVSCTMLFFAGLFFAGQAWAQSDEPTPPDKTEGKSDEPAPPSKGDEPAPPSKGDEPAPPTKGDEPTGAPTPGSADEPEGGEEPPAPPAAVAELKKKKEDQTSYGIGLHVRAIFVHEWLLGLFLDESTPLNSMAFGGEFIRHKGNLDLVAAVDFAFFSPEDGNYLGKNKNPKTKTDYVDFRGLNVLSFSAHVIWHQELTEWLSLVYGVGAGLGIVLGDVYRISNDPDRCTKENAGDINQCFPKGVNPATRDVDLARLTGGNDDPDDPHLFKEDDVPPVIPVIHMLVGLNFRVSEQVGIRVDGGFRNAFYIGVSGHWFL